MLERIIFGLFVALAAMAMDSSALAQDAEVMCRTKAKDVAVKMYQSCVTENRNKKIDEIRKEYQSKLSRLKKYYDGELKKVGGSQAAAKAAQPAPSAPMAPARAQRTTERAQMQEQEQISSAKAVEIPAPEIQTDISDSSDVETVNISDQ